VNLVFQAIDFIERISLANPTLHISVGVKQYSCMAVFGMAIVAKWEIDFPNLTRITGQVRLKLM